MLVLTRKINEAILVDCGRIRVVLVDVRGDKVRIGIEAGREIEVVREELIQGGAHGDCIGKADQDQQCGGDRKTGVSSSP